MCLVEAIEEEGVYLGGKFFDKYPLVYSFTKEGTSLSINELKENNKDVYLYLIITTLILILIVYGLISIVKRK